MVSPDASEAVAQTVQGSACSGLQSAVRTMLRFRWPCVRSVRAMLAKRRASSVAARSGWMCSGLAGGVALRPRAVHVRVSEILLETVAPGRENARRGSDTGLPRRRSSIWKRARRRYRESGGHNDAEDVVCGPEIDLQCLIPLARGRSVRHRSAVAIRGTKSTSCRLMRRATRRRGC